MSARNRRGFTLLELIVVVALIAILSSVAVTAGAWGRPSPDRASERAVVAAARARAIAGERPVLDSVIVDGHEALLRAFPDGSVIADSAVADSALDGGDR